MSDFPHTTELVDADLEDLKKMLSDVPPTDEVITFESVMEQENQAVSAKKSKSAAPPEPELDDDTKRFSKIAQEMKLASKQAAEESRRKSPEHIRPIASPQVLLDEEFEKTFMSVAVESGVLQEEDLPESLEEEEEERESVFQRFRTYLKRPTAPLETMPEQAYKRVAPYASSLHLRTLLAFFLTIPLFYAALAPIMSFPVIPALDYFSKPYLYILITTSLQILIMACAGDIIARGFVDLAHFRPGVETLVAVSAVYTLIHVFTLIAPIKGFREFAGFVPYTCVSGITVFFTLWASSYQYSAYRYTYATAMQANYPGLISCEENLWDNMSGYTKRKGSLEGFVSKTETPDLSRSISYLLAPFLLVATLLFAVIGSILESKPGNIFWALSAMGVAAASPVSLLVFALPFKRLAKRLFVHNSAIAGWTAARELKNGKFVVLQDEDFFPSELIHLMGMKVYNSHTYDQVTTVAAAMLRQAGSGLYSTIADKRRDKSQALPDVSDLQHHESGGLSGQVGRQQILIGSSSFMLSQRMRLDRELIIKRAIYVVIDMELAGIFAVNYVPSGSLASSLRLLQHLRITPLMAVRDFNITQSLVGDNYKVDPDLLGYPLIEDRLALSEPNRETREQSVAFVAKHGLAPIAECIVGAIRLRKAATLNLGAYLLGTLITFIGVFIFVKAGATDPSAAADIIPGKVLLLQLIWSLPIWISGSWAHRYK